MSAAYSREILKVVVAQICQTIGWHAVHSTALEVLTDVLKKYLSELGEHSHRYAEQFGHTQPNLHDVGLAFRDLGVDVSELQEYVRYVDSVPCAKEVPKYPVERESHLNLLKPGSREVVTRPVHIHEHLPAMHPKLEEEEYNSSNLSVDVNMSGSSASPPISSPKMNVFKRPGDPISIENPAAKRARLMEEEGRPLREITSVMMTTSGFLSPAREGKLPEARTPITSKDSLSRADSTQSLSSYPTVPPEVKGEKKIKKNIPAKSLLDNDKKFDSVGKFKDISKTDLILDEYDGGGEVKKLASMKELSKLKALKPGALKMMMQSGNSNFLNKPNQKLKNKGMAVASFNNNYGASQKCLKVLPPAKNFKTPTGLMSDLNSSKLADIGNFKMSEFEFEEKLPSEPDRQKLNIFKKISKVKEECKMEYSDSSFNKNINFISSSNNQLLSPSMRDGNMDYASSISETIESVIQQSSKIFSVKNERTSPVNSSIITSFTNAPNACQNSNTSMSDDDTFYYNYSLGTPRAPEFPNINKNKGEPKRRKKEKTLKEKKEVKEKLHNFESEHLEKPKTPEVDSERIFHDRPQLGATPLPFQSYRPPKLPNQFPLIPNPPINFLRPSINRLTPFPIVLGKQGSLIPPTMPSIIPPPIPISPLQTLTVPESPLLVKTTGNNKLSPNRFKTAPVPLEVSPPPPLSSPTQSQLSSANVSPIATTPVRRKQSPKNQEESPSVPVLLTTKHPNESPVSPIAIEKEEICEDKILNVVKEKSKEKKEHKKDKKDKIKKKKDKKDKTKNKIKGEKKKEKSEKKIKEKGKNKEKKDKKEKKREKEMRLAAAAAATAASSTSGAVLQQDTISPNSSLSTAERPIDDKQIQRSSTNTPAPAISSFPKLTLKIGPTSPQPAQSTLNQQPSADSTPHRKIVIKPVKKPVEDDLEEQTQPKVPIEAEGVENNDHREKSPPELARICALVTRPPKVKPSTSKTHLSPEATSTPTPSIPPPKIQKSKEISSIGKKVAKNLIKKPVLPQKRTYSYIDADGKTVWICPGCDEKDDGSPMVGCDGCDAWYHWVCVGIQVAPVSNDWFCDVCIAENNERVGGKKKKIRKKKGNQKK